MHAINYTGSLNHFSLLADDIYEVLHTKPLSSNSFTIIDIEMMSPNLCKHTTDTTEMLWRHSFSVKILKYWGRFIALWVNTKCFSLLCFYFYLWSISLSFSDSYALFHLSSRQSIRLRGNKEIRLLKQINAATKCNYKEHWLSWSFGESGFGCSLSSLFLFDSHRAPVPCWAGEDPSAGSSQEETR